MRSTRPDGSRALAVRITRMLTVLPVSRLPPVKSESISLRAVIVLLVPLWGVDYPCCHDAALGHSTLRPLARRAARVARPALVDMRLRNPWVFARLRLFGWYVRFTVSSVSRTQPEAGHEPSDYIDTTSRVSINAESQHPGGKFLQGRLLWMMWKTQDSIVLSLWIEFLTALS